MVFQVDIADPALLDAQEAFEFIRDVPSKPHAGEQWFRGLVEAIYSLEHNPERCPIVPEQLEFPLEIRHLIYLSHRIIFSVDREMRRVSVYRVYHGARSGLDESGIRPS